MASKRRIRRNSCKGKIGYLLEENAAAARKAILIRKRYSLTGYFHEYKCRFCNCWHLGHGKRQRQHPQPLQYSRY
jgi:hypothetical protein